MQAESVADQWPGAVQLALPVVPVVSAWPVAIDVCIEAEFPDAVGEGLVLRG